MIRTVELLVAQVSDALAQALPHGGRALVGYSGGMDSTVLLALVRQHGLANIELAALHVHHGLHARADAWLAYCQRRCRQWNVPLTVVHAKVRRQQRGMEARARAARLRAFARARADAILLAHHANDQAETVLLRALRGSGPRGMAAMRVMSRLPGSDKLLLRPLLGYARAELVAIARQLRVRGVRDPSNTDLRHNRNWLRHVVLPEAQKRFPGALAALLTVAEHAATTERLLAHLAQADTRAAVVDSGWQRVAVAKIGEARVANWIASCLAARSLPAPSQRHLREASRQVCITSRSFTIAFHGATLVCRQGKLSWAETAA